MSLLHQKHLTTVFDGEIVRILQEHEFNGKVKKEVAARSPGVRVILVTKNNDFVFSREYREYLPNKWDYRIPGGKVFDTLTEYLDAVEAGEEKLAQCITQAAKDEALQEVGARINSLEQIHVSPCGATVDWDLHYFVAKDFELGKQNLGHGEPIEVKYLSLLDTIDLVLDGYAMSEDRSRIVLLDYLIRHFPKKVAEAILERED